MHSATTMGTAAAGIDVRRGARLRAIALDLGLCAAMQIVLATSAVIVFMVQTDAGSRDLSSSAATTGWAIALAATPAWSGLLGHMLWTRNGTPGQRTAGLRVEGPTAQRLLRLAVHPVSALGWLWLALVSALATIPGLPLLLIAAAITALAAGVVSGVMLLRDPGTLALHDRLAGTRLVAR